MFVALLELLLELLAAPGSFGRRDTRIDGPHRWHMARVLGFFILFMIVGVLGMLWIGGPSVHSMKFLLALAFGVLWSLLGVVWTIRLAPYGDKLPPSWLMKHWSPLDAVLAIVALLAAVSALLV